MSKVTNILLVGVGGQGTILASKILSQVALESGFDVKMSEIHGMAQRGGSVVTQVRLGQQIFSPLVQEGEADIILAFEQLEALRWLPYLREDGAIIVNTQVIEPMPVITGVAQYPENIISNIRAKRANVTAVDALEKALEAGNPKASNVVLMGVLARKMGLDRELWQKALAAKIPAKLLEVNRRAFAAGYESA